MKILRADRGADIETIRTQFGYSQLDFAKILGVRQATVSDWETGKRKPSRLAQLAMINFGLSGPYPKPADPEK
jgi:DNA-binding transcriptional regulator YiaG